MVILNFKTCGYQGIFNATQVPFLDKRRMPSQINSINIFYILQTLDVGDLSERLELKKKLKCKPFSWFMDNVWPELFVLSRNVTAWGSVCRFISVCYTHHYYYAPFRRSGIILLCTSVGPLVGRSVRPSVCRQTLSNQ